MIYAPVPKFARPFAQQLDPARLRCSFSSYLAYCWHGGYLTATTLYNLKSQGIRNGTLGSAVTIGSGKFGNALKFGSSANDYVDLGNDLLQELNDYSLSMWMCVDAAGVGSQRIMYGETNSSQSLSYYHQVNASNVIIFGMFNGGGFSDAIGTQTIVSGQWYHYCATFSSILGGMKAYINGQLEASNANTSHIASGVHADIGALYHLTGRILPFQGMLDMLTIWNKALAPNEVAWLYQNPVALITPLRSRPSVGGSSGARTRSYAVPIV